MTRRGLIVSALVIATSVVGQLETVAGARSGVDGGAARYVVQFEPGAVAVTVKADDPRAPEIARDAVADLITNEVAVDGGRTLFDYDTLPFVAVETDDLVSLLTMPGVVGVTRDFAVERTLDLSVPLIDAADSDLNAAIGGTKADGTGTAVAIIDDGIDRTHPFFVKAGQSRVVAEACFTRGECPNGTDSQSGTGSAAHHPGDYHGTHVAGIAAGNSQGASWLPRGVAGNTDIAAVQVFNASGSAYTIDIDRALQWVYEQVSGGRDIASVNMSLGGSTIYSGNCSTTSSTKLLVDDLASVGVTVFVAAGNSGSKTGVSWPACLPNVVPVGATTVSDVVASYSNIGTQVRDRGVVAPGSNICSSVPTAVLTSGFGCLSGTSMASPHVAGLAALVRQADPTATVAEVKAAVRTTSTVLSDTRTGGTITGLRRINAWEATGAVLPDHGEVRGVVTATTGGSSTIVASTSVSVAMTSSNQVSGPASVSVATVTDIGGSYRLRVPAGTWSSVFSVEGLNPSGVLTDSVVATNATERNVTLSSDPGSISGAIDQSGPVFANAEFRLEPTGSNANDPVAVFLSPLAIGGEFSLVDVRPGTWSLTILSDAYASDPILVTVAALGDTSVGTVTLLPQIGTIAGTVNDALTQVSLSGLVTIEGTPTGTIGTRTPFTTQATLDQTGTFSLSGIRAGEWTLDVTIDDYASGQITAVAVANGLTTNTTFELDPLPGVVSGNVSDPMAVVGFGLQSVVIDDRIDLTLTPEVPSVERSTITVTQSLGATGGTFSVTNVVPGNWTLTGRVFGFEPLPATSLTVTPNGSADLGLFSLVRRTAVADASPASGTTAGGTLVTIYGKHLTGATAVDFGGVAADPATITVVDDTQITVKSPSSPAGTVAVSVTTPIGSSTEDVVYSFVAPAPVLGGGGGGGGGGALWPASQSFVASSTGEVTVRVIPSVGAVDFELRGAYGLGTIKVDPRAGRPSVDKGGIILPTGWLDVTSTISSFSSVEVCAPIGIFSYEFYGITVDDLRLFHWVDGVREDITTRVDRTTKQVCGSASSFSPFAVGALQTRRLAGADRYETAVKISTSEFSPGVRVVYVVTGEKFPDALAAGAAAGRESGPVLLTRFGALPSSTRTELIRLKPQRVIVVGGPAVIDSVVVDTIKGIVGSVPVERVWGADRFETSALLSQRTFAATGGTVYVGSGLGFTEVLAAAAAAGRDRAPLLLVPGTGASAGVPFSIGVEVLRLAPTKMVVVGGAQLVSPLVVDQLKFFAPNAIVTQIGGADAYETAAEVALTFSLGGTVLVATGMVFADGLAGGAVAASRGYAMVMVPPAGSLPSAVTAALSTLAPRQIKVLGGPAAIEYDVENAVARYLPS